jgi:hypothetical protein
LVGLCFLIQCICRLWNGFHFLWCSIHYCSVVFFYIMFSNNNIIISSVVFMFEWYIIMFSSFCLIVWGSIAQPTSCVMWKVCFTIKMFSFSTYSLLKWKWTTNILKRPPMQCNVFIMFSSFCLYIRCFLHNRYVRLLLHYVRSTITTLCSVVISLCSFGCYSIMFIRWLQRYVRRLQHYVRWL